MSIVWAFTADREHATRTILFSHIDKSKKPSRTLTTIFLTTTQTQFEHQYKQAAEDKKKEVVKFACLINYVPSINGKKFTLFIIQLTIRNEEEYQL